MSDVSFGQLVRMVRGCLNFFIDDKESDVQSAVAVA